MDALEKFIDNVQAGKGRYGLCDACLNRQGDYNLYRRSDGVKPLLLPKSLKE